VRNLGEPRHASRSLRRDNGAFGSLPYQDCSRYRKFSLRESGFLFTLLKHFRPAHR
jgi:hypothetical protein